MDTPTEPVLDDNSDIGVRRELKRMKGRVVELELLVATQLQHIVPTNITTARDKHGLACGLHPHVTVSLTTTRVVCTICGEHLDALDVLRSYATAERSFAMNLEHLREECSKLRAELISLRNERASLKSQIKRKKGPAL
jgi:hypothetical protein